jgi:hypothetical protein
MATPASIDVDEVKVLLASTDLAQVETAIASRLRCQLVPSYNIMHVWEKLWVANISLTACLECLRLHPGALIALHSQLCALPDEGEEYAPGEEPEPEEVPTTLDAPRMIANGLGLDLVCYFIFLQRGNLASFSKWLKRFRYPHAKKFQQQLKRIYVGLAVQFPAGRGDG